MKGRTGSKGVRRPRRARSTVISHHAFGCPKHVEGHLAEWVGSWGLEKDAVLEGNLGRTREVPAFYGLAACPTAEIGRVEKRKGGEREISWVTFSSTGLGF